MSAGKGDTPRAVNGEVFRRNYDRIFSAKKVLRDTTVYHRLPQMTKPPTPATPGSRAHGRSN